MKNLLSLGLLAVLCTAGCNAPATTPEADHSETLPASLAALYPPQAEAPVYLVRMHDLSMPLATMMSDLMAQDFPNAAASFEAFRTTYSDVATLVPEWQDQFPSEPVDAMAAALESGNPDAVMAAGEGIGQVCHSCHVSSMATVQQLYRWPRFSDVHATDPITQGEIPLRAYMMNMEVAMVGVVSNVQRGQLDRARQNYDVFSTRFRGLADMCTECHDTERTYFIDESVLHVLDQLGATVNSDAPAPDQVMGLVMRIGEESCGRCHLVHAPAALTQARLLDSH